MLVRFFLGPRGVRVAHRRRVGALLGEGAIGVRSMGRGAVGMIVASFSELLKRIMRCSASKASICIDTGRMDVPTAFSFKIMAGPRGGICFDISGSVSWVGLLVPTSFSYFP